MYKIVKNKNNIKGSVVFFPKIYKRNKIGI